MSNEQCSKTVTVTFHCTNWVIGILILADYNPPIYDPGLATPGGGVGIRDPDSYITG